jgi:4'-phosphopantetheinyl transferase
VKAAALFLSEDLAGREDLLSPAERQRLATLTAPGRRAQFIQARTLLHLALERLLHEPADSFAVSAEDGAGPSLADGPFLSLSHTHGLVACLACFQGPCGLDVEDGSVQRDFAALSRHSLGGPIPAGEDFYRAWCLHEARIKQPQGAAGLFRHRHWQGAVVLPRPPLEAWLHQGGRFEPLPLSFHFTGDTA